MNLQVFLIEECSTLTDGNGRESYRHIRDTCLSERSLNLFIRLLACPLFRQLGYLSPTVTDVLCDHAGRCSHSDVTMLGACLHSGVTILGVSSL